MLKKNITEKVLTIGPDYRNHRGGIGAVIENYNKYFDKFKFIPTYKVGNVFYKSIFFIKSIFKLFLILVTNKNIKIVHIHGASNKSFYRKFFCFIIARYIFRKKTIYHIHGAEFHLFYSKKRKLTKNLIKRFINNVDCVICLSEKWKTFFEFNFKPKHIIIIPNIIDYPQQSMKNEISSCLTFLFLGLVGKRKGIFDLIGIIIKNKEKYNGHLRLVIGGNGEINKLRDLIRHHELENLVEFVGWITNEEKIKWLQHSDIYILPSYNEGLPISILEAMSYKQAIISTNVGGIPEIVIPFRNGILIEPGNLNEIENAIDFFIDHPETIETYGKESEQLVMKHLPESVMLKLFILYESLLYTPQG